MKRAVAIGFILALACACSKNQPSDKTGPSQPSSSLLEYIPADSPLVMVSPEPMPRVITDWIGQSIAPVVDRMQTFMKEQQAATSDRLTRAILAELDGRLSRTGMESLGFTFEPRFAVYAIGLSLAVRLELADGAKVSALLDRIERNSGQALPMASFQGVTYRQFAHGDMLMVVAVIGNELVGGLMHKGADKQVLPVLFGKTRPQKTLADAGIMGKYRDRYQLLGVSFGYIDLPAVLAMVMGEASPLTQEIIRASGVELPAMSPTCRDELTRLVSTAPRMIFGYQDLTPSLLRLLFAVELREDVAGELMSLQSPVLDLTALGDGRPLLAMGINADLGKLIGFMKGKLAEMVAAPYHCEYLADLNQMVSEMSSNLDTPLPEFVSGFKGVALSVNDIQMNGFIPSGSGYLAVAMSDVMSAYRAMSKEIPQLASINLRPDGKPVSVPLGMPGLPDLQLSATPDRLKVALGSGMLDRANQFVASKTRPDSPMAVIACDYGRFVKLLSQTGGVGGEEMAIISVMASLLGQVRIDFRFTGDGLVMTETVEPGQAPQQQAQ